VRSLILPLALASCTTVQPPVAVVARPPASDRVTTAPSAKAPASVAGAPSDDPPCPAIDFAALEPVAPEPDARTVALSHVFEAREARPPNAKPKAAVPRFQLDPVHLQRRRPGPSSGWLGGMGWMGLNRAWVDGTIGPEVREPFEAWVAASEGLQASQRAGYLLFVRARYARSISPPAAWGGLRCTERAATELEQQTAAAERDMQRVANELRTALESVRSRSAGESMLLAVLLLDEVPFPRDPTMADVARPLEMLTALAKDPKVDRELRARAAEQVARAQSSSRSKAFKAALQQVLRLTRDPELKVETLIKLAEIAGSPREAEKLNTTIIRRLDAQGGGWQVARVLSTRAEQRLERGAFALALNDAARCARESPTEFPRNPDPWGCAPLLAEALAELARPPGDESVPLPFLGPLALASMKSALARYDHDQARRVGTLLLQRLPQAAEAPEVVSLLLALAVDAPDRAALEARQTRDYGPEGAWEATQHERLAWDHEPKALREQLAALTDAPRRHIVGVPESDQEFQRQLAARAVRVAEACKSRLGRPGQRIRIHVDTTGPTPKASVSGGGAAVARCTQRAVRAEFRSVGPARIDYKVLLASD